MYNKPKPEQLFALTSDKRSSSLTSMFKLVREETGAQLFNNDNNH